MLRKLLLGFIMDRTKCENIINIRIWIESLSDLVLQCKKILMALRITTHPGYNGCKGFFYLQSKYIETGDCLVTSLLLILMPHKHKLYLSSEIKSWHSFKVVRASPLREMNTWDSKAPASLQRGWALPDSHFYNNGSHRHNLYKMLSLFNG